MTCMVNTCLVSVSAPDMYALYVRLICMPSMYTGNACRVFVSDLYALYVCLIYIYIYIWLICMSYMYALYVCLICMSYMYALYVCLICMPYFCSWLREQTPWAAVLGGMKCRAFGRV